MIVSGQCREFKATVIPWDEGLERPAYHGKGKLLGHVAVTAMMPLLPAGSRDRDARGLQAVADTCRVVALCRDMPFEVRRAGAWQLVSRA